MLNERLRALPQRVEALPGLLARGRLLDFTLMIEAQGQQWLLPICSGQVSAVKAGPFVMPAFDVALRADMSEWSAFLQDTPAPGHHDLMALVKRRALRIDGNAGLVMGNLFYFKALLCLLRENPQPDQAAPLPVPAA